MMFKISKNPIKTDRLKKKLEVSCIGAIVVFEGVVRNTHNGKRVVALEYELYEDLVLSEAARIMEETLRKFKIHEVQCVHRVGKLRVKETAVWVGVSAQHRFDAFRAAQYVIDEIKARLPIWKKECYSDGTASWVVQPLQTTVLDEKEFYARQMIVPEISTEGQNKLKESSVLVVGAGGLGSAALMYLASAGIGTIGICEHDVLEVSNLHRQFLYSHGDVGKFKAHLASGRLKATNPFVSVEVIDEKLLPENGADIIQPFDIILECTDNLPTKFLLNDLAVIQKKPLVLCSVYQLEGQVQVVNSSKETPCLRCLWLDLPADQNRTSQGNGILGVTAGILGIIQATEAIKYLLGLAGGLDDEVLYFDLRHYHAMKIRQSKNPSCPLCGNRPRITTIAQENYQENIFANR